MLLLATNWTTLSSLATALGTLVLAIATFAAVRSSNRAATLTEAALQEQRRPVLVASRLDDPHQKLNFADGHWVSADGGRSAAVEIEGNVYLAISLRNVGSGIGVCQGWSVLSTQALSSDHPTHLPLDEFRMQTRDLYIPGSDVGMWQGALRNPDDPMRDKLARAINNDQPLTVELLYSDLAGRQRTITRFQLIANEDGERLTSTSRHWFLDWDGPRPESPELVAEMKRVHHEAS